jgi:NADPH:quinone reductase-like Zn-dependent oxidoreductase
MMKWTVLNSEKGFEALKYGDGLVPKCGENEVLVKLHGASLNYRDLIIPQVCRLLSVLARDLNAICGRHNDMQRGLNLDS